MMLSNCCGTPASIEAVEMGICPACKEHCEFDEEEEETGTRLKIVSNNVGGKEIK